VPTYYGVTDIHKASVLTDLLPYLDPDMPKFNVQWPHREDVHNDAFTWVEKDEEWNQVANKGFQGLGYEFGPVPTGRTTPITLAQLAAWMGYREFYFLGIEQTRGYVYEPEAIISFSGRDSFPLDKNPRYQQAIQRSAVQMRKDVEAAGGHVYDCTPGGLLNETNEVHRRGIRMTPILEYRNLADVLMAAV
jgi:hypothetical protein